MFILEGLYIVSMINEHIPLLLKHVRDDPIASIHYQRNVTKSTANICLRIKPPFSHWCMLI